MINLAVGILWLIIGIIVLGAVIWILLWAIRTFVAPAGLEPRIEQAIWAVFAILVLIYLLTAIAGGGLPHPAFFRD
jgi:hypothetical protein